jgi:hypothetical protein
LRLLTIFICLLVCSAHSCSEPQNSAVPVKPEQVKSEPGDITCRLESSKDRYRVGDQPEISARIINRAENPIYLVKGLDGSERKARFPHVYYTVSGVEAGLSDTLFPVCGVLNPLQTEDFVRVEPGSDFYPYKQTDDHRFYRFSASGMLVHSRFAKPGSYTFEFHYFTDNADIRDWRGSVSNTPPELHELLRKVARVNLECSLAVNVAE